MNKIQWSELHNIREMNIPDDGRVWPKHLKK